MARKSLEFVETVGFTKKLSQIASPDTLLAIQADLIENAERWPLIKATNGARKARIADPESSRGKSGSMRYYYTYLRRRGRIYLLAIFAKNEASDLSPKQKEQLAKIIAAIQKEDR
jgi:hypothetical protein